MTNGAIILEAKAISLAELIDLARSENFTINSTYQRSKAWKLSNKIKLIESILNGYCIGLFTFKIKENSEWEVLDGQQRLDTIFTFMGEELNTIGDRKKKFNFNGLTYEEIINDSSKRHVFEGAKICYVLLPPTMSEPKTAKYFVALQEGRPLIPPEKLNAKLGFIRDKIVEYAGKLPVISNDKFMKDIRFSRRHLTAQILHIELNTNWSSGPPNFPSYRAQELYDLYEDYTMPSQTKRVNLNRSIKTMYHVLKKLEVTLKRDLKFIKSFGFFIPVYLLTSYLYHNNFAFSLNKYRNFIIDFRVNVNEAAKIGRGKYTTFKLLISAGTTGENLKTKFEILKEEFDNKFGTRLKRLDPRRNFTQPMKMAIYRKFRGKCFFYNKSRVSCSRRHINFDDSDASYHHIKFYCEGGRTRADNGALCHLECHRKFHDLPNKKDTDL